MMYELAGAQYHREMLPKGNLNTFMAFKDVNLFVG